MHASTSRQPAGPSGAPIAKCSVARGTGAELAEPVGKCTPSRREPGTQAWEAIGVGTSALAAAPGRVPGGSPPERDRQRRAGLLPPDPSQLMMTRAFPRAGDDGAGRMNNKEKEGGMKSPLGLEGERACPLVVAGWVAIGLSPPPSPLPVVEAQSLFFAWARRPRQPTLSPRS